MADVDHYDEDDEAAEALPQGTLLQGDQFTITRKLANGGFGITYLATDNYLDRDVVIKECFPEAFCQRSGQNVTVRSAANQKQFRSIVDMFMREARSIATMRHPNIVGVHRVFEGNETAYMALDLIDGEDLLDIVQEKTRNLTPVLVKDILIKILDAVETVHQKDLLHRDISPDNILLDKWGSPVLIDFGAAREEASKETRALSSMLVVKDGYSPQEFYFAGGKQSPNSDLYALGATFYHVISGEAPPNSQTRMAEVASQNPDPCIPLEGRIEGYDAVFLQAIDKAMSVLPKERIQSARAWLKMINADHKRIAPVVPRMTEKKLGKELTRLVSETNEYVLKSRPISPEFAPPPVVKKRKIIPDWVREFNAETSAIDDKARTEGAPGPVYATRSPTDQTHAKPTSSGRAVPRVVLTNPSRSQARTPSASSTARTRVIDPDKNVAPSSRDTSLPSPKPGVSLPKPVASASSMAVTRVIDPDKNISQGDGPDTSLPSPKPGISRPKSVASASSMAVTRVIDPDKDVVQSDAPDTSLPSPKPGVSLPKPVARPSSMAVTRVIDPDSPVEPKPVENTSPPKVQVSVPKPTTASSSAVTRVIDPDALPTNDEDASKIAPRKVQVSAPRPARPSSSAMTRVIDPNAIPTLEVPVPAKVAAPATPKKVSEPRKSKLILQPIQQVIPDEEPPKTKSKLAKWLRLRPSA